MEKKINYMSRDFSSIKDELLNFSKEYYPELSDSFNDTGVGSWLIDLFSAVGDDLSYHTDRMYQETNIDSATLKSTLLNIARSNGLNVPGAKASVCEVEVSVDIPVSTTDISKPDWAYAPIILRGTTFSAGNYTFHTTEDVNFADQFNMEGYSNRTFVPNKNANGNIVSYTVSKKTVVSNGTMQVYKKVINTSDLTPFMEVILPDTNVMNVESIIFKETSNYSNSPAMSEYYVDAEQYRLSSESSYTYRFFEVNSLAQTYRWGAKANIDENTDIIANITNPDVYDDYTETILDGDGSGSTRTSRYYKGEWKPLVQKFITEYTDNGYMKIIFGSGVKYDTVPSGQTSFADLIASNIINNEMLGVLPKAGWSMYILYSVGGGVDANLAANSINNIGSVSFAWTNLNATDGTVKGSVEKTLSVTNTTAAVAGKDAPSSDELKYLIKYNTGSQERCVTLKDYEVRLSQMPPKYGAPFRSMAIEKNNKIEMSFLGLNANRKLDSALPQTLVENVMSYMEGFKSINDYLEIKSGKIYDIGFTIDIFVDKSYTTSDVVTSVINLVSDYMSVENHQMGEDIFIGDLEKNIGLVDGVSNLISLKVWNIFNGKYSSSKSPLPRVSVSTTCTSISNNGFNLNTSGSYAEELDMESVDKVLYGDYNSMYEILNDKADIQVRVKTR